MNGSNNNKNKNSSISLPIFEYKSIVVFVSFLFFCSFSPCFAFMSSCNHPSTEWLKCLYRNDNSYWNHFIIFFHHNATTLFYQMWMREEGKHIKYTSCIWLWFPSRLSSFCFILMMMMTMIVSWRIAFLFRFSLVFFFFHFDVGMFITLYIIAILHVSQSAYK